MKDKHVLDCLGQLGAIASELQKILGQLKEKHRNLSISIDMPSSDLPQLISDFTKSCSHNQLLFNNLSKLVSDSGNERRSIQREACESFQLEFGSRESASISDIRLQKIQLKELVNEITELRRTQGDKADARMRVAETFKILLKRFFGEKYTFDEAHFKILREQQEMPRGSDRTLSDGEKSEMAFCYFLAQSHLRVTSNEDYARLYYVFDDPVTSMSFDYVYAIVQTLKLLRISAGGEIAFNPTSPNPRPRMLILTHNNYFYNVASSNRAIRSGGLFQLVPGTMKHKLSSQRGFATPHQQQLQHVFDVSEGHVAPDYMTPNCIRSVVESMWKFCRPDLDDFGKFFEFLIAECNIELKSALIQDLSHGGKFDDPPHREEDIIGASKEAIEVVRRFAEGQLKRL